MTILHLVLLFVIVGFVLYLVNNFIPMEGRVKSLMNTAVIIALVIVLIVWAVQMLGGGGSIPALRL